MSGITLILDRTNGDLWIDRNSHIVCVWNVTGVERIDSIFSGVRVLQKGKTIGMVWNVKEIKERWEE